MREVCFHLSWAALVRMLTVVGLIWLAFRLPDVWVTLAFSLLVFASLLPAVDRLGRRLPRPLAVAVVLVTGLLLVGLAVSLLLPPIVEQIRQLVASFPFYVNRITGWFGWLTDVSGRYAFLPSWGALLGSLPARFAGFLGQTLGWTVTLASGLAGLVTALIISVFLLGDTARLREHYLRFFPRDRRERVGCLTDHVLLQVGAYVRGQALVMTAVGVLTGLGLGLVGVDYAAALGLLAGVLDIIPMVGPIIAAVPGLLIALGVSPLTALLALLVYLAVQQIESQFLSPVIVGKVVGLPPVVIIVSLLIGGGLLGVVGIILAVPAAAALQVLVSELYLKRINPPETLSEEEAA